MIFIFQVQSLTGSSIPFFSPLEASTPKCFRQQVPWTLSYSRQERYQPPHLLSISEHVQHVNNGRSATCQKHPKQQPFQGRRISRMPKTTVRVLFGLFWRIAQVLRSLSPKQQEPAPKTRCERIHGRAIFSSIPSG